MRSRSPGFDTRCLRTENGSRGALGLLLCGFLVALLGTGTPAGAGMQGPNSPGQVVNDSSFGTATWTNPGNAKASDDLYAQAAPGGSPTQYLRATNFGFAIPGAAVIKGITVAIERHCLAGTIMDSRVRIVKAGIVGATERAQAGAWPTTDAVATYGGAADLWGQTWTAADVNDSAFGAVLSVNDSADLALVDQITITVVFSVCGNSIIEPGEQCDDGNAAAGDCCSPTCQFEPSGTSCAPPGSDPCTADVCDGSGACLLAQVCIDQPISGRKLAISRSSSGREKASFVSKDPNALFPVPSSLNDPRFAGGEVDLFSANEGIATFQLPAGIEWSLNRSGTSYKYKNREAPGGPSPVKVALIKDGRGVKVSSKETGLPLTGPQGQVAIRIRTGRERSCAVFGGPTIAKDEAGKFQAKNAPVPALADCTDASLLPGATTTTSSTTSTTNTTATTSTTATTTTTSSTTSTTGGTTTTTTTTTTTSTSSTTSTSTSSTTSTTGGGFTRLSYETMTGTTGCGGPGLSPAATAPLSGQLYSNTSLTTAIAGGGGGLGCLYIGGGAATTVAPLPIPDHATSILSISGTTLTANAGTSPKDCTLGVAGTKHCISEVNTGASCSTDSNCEAAAPGSCAPDANCFFGPPLALPNGALSTCVMNVVRSDVTGTGDPNAMGAVTLNLPLASRVYLTGNSTSPCPKCVSAHCVGGARNTLSCTTVSTGMTTIDCPPTPAQFVATLTVSLNPLTTSQATLTATVSSGTKFCNPQSNAGAFGKSTARGIKNTGATSSVALTDGNPHNVHLAATFCVPATGNLAIDGAADIPGPGAASLNGNAQLLP